MGLAWKITHPRTCSRDHGPGRAAGVEAHRVAHRDQTDVHRRPPGPGGRGAGPGGPRPSSASLGQPANTEAFTAMFERRPPDFAPPSTSPTPSTPPATPATTPRDGTRAGPWFDRDDLLGVPLRTSRPGPVAEGRRRPALAATADTPGRSRPLGHHRYWVAEHHGMPGIASSLPAGATRPRGRRHSIDRLGPGGVMLPNHAPPVVAEFRDARALHPGRIDSDLGRAPGTDPVTAHAIRRQRLDGPDEFEPARRASGYFDGSIPDDHPFGIEATPAHLPPTRHLLLGSSDFSATLAGSASASPSRSLSTTSPLLAWRRRWHLTGRRSTRPTTARALRDAGGPVVCAETDEHGRWLAAPGNFAFLRLRQGAGPLPHPEAAARQPHAGGEGGHPGLDRLARRRRSRARRGGARHGAGRAHRRAGAGMVSTMVTDVDERRRSADFPSPPRRPDAGRRGRRSRPG